MKIQVIQTLPNGQVTQQVLSKDGAEVLKIQAQPGAKVSFNFEGGKPVEGMATKPKTGDTKKVGNNLILESEGEQLVEVTDFYSTAGASVGDVGWKFASADAGVTTATPEAQALASDAAVADSGALLPSIAPGWLVAGGVATAAAVASGGSSGVTSLSASTTTVVSGVITAGQLVAGHGLTVQFYKKDGVTLLGTPVSVDATGHFSTTLSVGAGEAIIAKVIDASTGNDFKDEATNANKDLNAALMTVGVSNGGSLVLNINPLTTIAAQKAGLSSDGLTGSVADAAAVTSANAAVAKAFGVSDITTTTPDVTNDGAFDGTTAAGKIGAILAAISGADLANGGNAQATIDALTLAVNTTAGTLTTAQQIVLAQGAAVAEAGSGVTGVVGALSSALAAQNGSTSVSINSVTADNILNASEATTGVVAHSTKITGTNATGATVVLAFGIHAMTGTVTALTATTWEYEVTSADITNLGADGGQSVTATATLTGGATAAATRVFVLNAVNDAPLVAITSVSLVDTAAADTFANQIGTLSAVDPEGTTPLTYGITGSGAGATVGNVVYDVSKVGTYGTLYVKSTTGEYVFVANATAINHVSANATESFAVTASDGTLSGAATLTVNVTGADDAPVLVSGFVTDGTPSTGDSDYLQMIVGQTPTKTFAADFVDPDTGDGALVFSVISGSVPGVTFNANGTLTGTPSDAGITYPHDYTVKIRATDANNSALYVEHDYVIHMLKAPVAQSISVLDTTSSNTTAIGKAGETLDVSVVFSEVVDVVGSPTITLSINGQATTATYSSGSGAINKTLHFTVAIPSGSAYDGHSISLTGVSPNVTGVTTVIGHDSGQSWDATPMPAAYTGYIVDNTPPSAPVLAEYLTTHVADSYLNNSESTTTTFRATLPTTGSTAVAGDKVELLLGGASFGTAKTVTLSVSDITNGYVDFTVLKADLGTEGSKSLTSRVTDLAGNVGTASAAVTFTLDTVPPAAVTTLLEQGSTDLTDGYMNNSESTTTTFRSTFPTTGSTAVAGDKVELLLGGASFGTAKIVTLSATSITNGYVDFTVLKADLGADGNKSLTSRITDIAGNVGAVNGTALAFTFDATAPTVTSFSSTTANGSYKAGQTVNVTATMDNTVQAGATFVATMDTGETVTLTAGSAGTTLVGTYTIGANKTSADLTVSSYTAGTVLDVAGNAMTATVVPTGTNNIAGSKAIVVDTTAPTVTSTALTVNENLTAVGSLLANEAVTWAIGTGLDSALFSLTGANGLTWAAHNYEGDAHAYSVNVVATDSAGNQTTQTVAISLANANEAPTLAVGYNGGGTAGNDDYLTIARGSAITNTALQNDFTDPDGAGALGSLSYSLASGAMPTGLTLNADGSISGIATAAAGDYTVHVRVTDHGVTGDMASKTLDHDYTVHLVDAPTLSSSIHNTAAVGAPFTVSNLEVTSNIVFTASESISSAVAGKYVHIINDGGVGLYGEATVNTQDILVTDTSKVSFSGGKITINPGSDLDFANNYHITIDDGAFLGASGLATVGISSATDFAFSTVTPTAKGSNTGAASQMMDSTGALAAGHAWLDMETRGDPGAGSVATAANTFNAGTANIAFVAGDYQGGPGGALHSANDGTATAAFWLRVYNFGSGDLVYIDNRGNNAAVYSPLEAGVNDTGVPDANGNITQLFWNGNTTDGVTMSGNGGQMDVTLAAPNAATGFDMNTFNSLLAQTSYIIG